MNDAHRFGWRFFRQLISIVFPERCKTVIFFFLLTGFIRLAKILRAPCASYTCHNPCSRSLRQCRDFAELMFVLFAFFSSWSSTLIGLTFLILLTWKVGKRSISSWQYEGDLSCVYYSVANADFSWLSGKHTGKEKISKPVWGNCFLSEVRKCF